MNCDALFRHFNPSLINSTICISLKNKYVYFEVPKSGCSTIKTALHSVELDGIGIPASVGAHPLPHHSPFVKPYQLGRERLIEILQDPNFFKFSFVRNPFPRLLSAYLDKILGSEGGYIAYYRNPLGFAADAEISFGEFVERVSQQTPKLMDKHWMPQVYPSFANFIDLDFVGKLESFAEDFASISGRLCVKSDPEKIAPHGRGADEKLTDFYTPQIAKVVAETYRMDFEAFGYDLKQYWVPSLTKRLATMVRG